MDGAVTPLPELPDHPDAAAARLVGDRLRAVGYEADGVERLLGGDGAVSGAVGDLDGALFRLRGASPLETAVRLFVCEAPVAADVVSEAIGEDGVAAATALGLVRREGASLAPAVRIVCFEGILLASDLLGALLDDPHPDYVGTVNPTTKTLAALTVRRPVGSALDLGTGCGVQAFLAARHAGTVVATDVNPRAVAFTRLNAGLNGIENVEARRGDLLEPVAGETFDLVVANPPYVVSPDTTLVLRDGTRPGGEVSRLIVEAVPAHLRPGGFAHVLCSWGRAKSTPWDAVPRSWVDGSGCDALLLYHGSEDPLAYAISWNRLLRQQDREAYRAALARWLAFFAENGVEELDYGSVTLRSRRAGTPWVRAERLPAGGVSRPRGGVEAYVDAVDRLEAIGADDALLDLPLRLTDAHRVEQVLRIEGGEVVLDSSQLKLTDGLGFEGPVDAMALAILSLCDGTRPVREAVAQVAERTGQDAAALTEELAAVLRRLVELGLLH